MFSFYCPYIFIHRIPDILRSPSSSSVITYVANMKKKVLKKVWKLFPNKLVCSPSECYSKIRKHSHNNIMSTHTENEKKNHLKHKEKLFNPLFRQYFSTHTQKEKMFFSLSEIDTKKCSIPRFFFCVCAFCIRNDN